MATLAELRAEAKRQKRKGYSKLKKAELEKLLDTPPPKPPRGVPRKKPAPVKKDDDIFDVVRATIGGVKYLVEAKKSQNREVFPVSALKQEDPKPIGYISGEITPKTEVRFIKDNVKIPYKQVARKKNSDGIQIISVPLFLILTILEVEEGVKTIYADDEDYQKDMTRISRSLKRQFLKQYDNSYAEKTTKEWEKVWNKFTDEEEEKAKKKHLKKFGKMDYLH